MSTAPTAPDLEEQQHSLQIRGLRFDPDLERPFRGEYDAKSVRYLRVFVPVLIAVIVAPFLPLLAGVPLGAPLTRGLASMVVGVIALACLLVVALRPGLRKWTQASIAFAALVIFADQTAAYAGLLQPSGADPRVLLLKYYAVVAVILVGVYVASRLRFVAATLVSVVMLAVALVTPAVLARPPAGTLAADFSQLLVLNLLAMYAGHSMERSARRDFLALHLLDAERNRSESLLLNILPAPIAVRLKSAPSAIADSFAEVSVLFADLVDFTALAARLSPAEVVRLLNRVFSAFDDLAERHGLEKIKTIGDAYMVAGGLPVEQEGHAAAIAELALGMREVMVKIREDEGLPLQLRIGINVGPVTAGVIGTKKFLYDLWGDTVNIASRLEAQSEVGAILVTEAAYLRLRDHYHFEPHAPVHIKGRGLLTPFSLIGRRAD